MTGPNESTPAYLEALHALEAPESSFTVGVETILPTDMPCICELTGHCAGCETLPWVIRQRRLTRTVQTFNSSPSSWDSINREP